MSHEDPYRPNPGRDRGAYTPPTDDDLPFNRQGYDPRAGARLRLAHHLIAGHIGAVARQFHPVLVDEGLQQLVELLHDVAIAGDLVRAVLLDQADALVLDVARDNPGKRPAQVGGQFMRRQLAA